MSRALHVDDSLSQFIQSHLQVWKIRLGNTNSHTWNATNLYQKEYFKIQNMLLHTTIIKTHIQADGV